MKRIVLLLLGLAAIVLPAVASAHPLGNFTVNRFSRIEVAGPRIYVRYVLDLAEIPTFQAGKIDAHSYARRLADGAHLTVNGRRARLIPVETALAHPAGAGGLKTTRLETVLQGPILHAAEDIEYRDTNYANRIGWKEIVVGPLGHVRTSQPAPSCGRPTAWPTPASRRWSDVTGSASG